MLKPSRLPVSGRPARAIFTGKPALFPATAHQARSRFDGARRGPRS